MNLPIAAVFSVLGAVLLAGCSDRNLNEAKARAAVERFCVESDSAYTETMISFGPVPAPGNNSAVQVPFITQFTSQGGSASNRLNAAIFTRGQDGQWYLTSADDNGFPCKISPNYKIE